MLRWPKRPIAHPRQTLSERTVIGSGALPPRMAAPWRYCCRTGTRDEGGKQSVKGCHGCASHTLTRKWEYGISGAAKGGEENFWRNQVDDLLTSGAQLPGGVTPQAAARQLREAVTPARAVDSPRVCHPCWAAARWIESASAGDRPPD